MKSRRRLARVLLLTLAVGGAVAVPAAPAAACSCAPTTDTAARATADAVFVGEVVARRDTPAKGGVLSSVDPAVFVVKVSRVYKGRVFATQEVVTARLGASCGLELPPAGPALFFAFATGAPLVEGDLEPGQLSSHLCSGTRAAVAAPASWGPGEPPVARSAAAGTPDAGSADRHAGRSDPDASLSTVTVLTLAAALAAAAVLGLRRTRLPRTLPVTDGSHPAQ